MGTSSGTMTEDEVLSGAIEVFNSSVQTGTSAAGTAGSQNTPGVLDNTASGTGQRSGTNAPATARQGSGSTSTAGTASVSGSNGAQTTAGSSTAGNGTSARRVVVVGSGSEVVTGQERVEILDRELDASMGVFDGVILSRRQEAIARTNETGAGQTVIGNGADGTGGDAGSAAPPLLTAGSGAGDPNNNRTSGQLPDAQSDNRQGEYSNQGSGNPNVPADISDGSDDDIVARQLREAAMQEQDPVLREKLWEEYRKYKQGVQAK